MGVQLDLHGTFLGWEFEHQNVNLN